MRCMRFFRLVVGAEPGSIPGQIAKRNLYETRKLFTNKGPDGGARTAVCAG